MLKVPRLARAAAEDAVASELRAAILKGVLAPETRLRQEELAEQFGVSRMPIRQALLALEREGLVRTNRWRQTVVAPVEADMIRDMYAFRAVVERHVAETLATRHDFDSMPVRRVILAGRRAIASGDVSRAIELDLQFHTMLYDGLGNRVLSSFMRAQWAHIRRVMAVTLTLPRLRARVWDEHASILDAIDARDAVRAAAAAETHMRAASSALLDELRSLEEQRAQASVADGSATPVVKSSRRGSATGRGTARAIRRDAPRLRKRT